MTWWSLVIIGVLCAVTLAGVIYAIGVGLWLKSTEREVRK